MERRILLIIVSVIAILAGLARAEDEQWPTTVPTSMRAQPAELLVGRYCGTVRDNETDDVPVITSFWRDATGAVVGDYTIGEGASAYAGTLSNVVTVDPLLYVCHAKWTDKYGSGVLVLWVHPSGTRFSGRWGNEDGFATEPWNGTRVDQASPTTSPAATMQSETKRE